MKKLSLGVFLVTTLFVALINAVSLRAQEEMPLDQILPTSEQSVPDATTQLQESTNEFEQPAEPIPTQNPFPNRTIPQTGINLTISPHFINVTTDPGQAVVNQIKVRNNSNVNEYLRIYLARFQPDVNGESPVLVDIDPDDPFPSWLTFDTPEFMVTPNENKIVRFTLQPPMDAALGYYYAVVISRMEENDEGSSGTVISGSPAVPLLLEVRSPNSIKELQLVEFTTDKFIYEYLPVSFNIRVKNSGNIHVIPFGDIFIDWGGTPEVGMVPANPGRGNILPQTTRMYSSVWDDAFIVNVPKQENGSVVVNAKGETQYTAKWDFTKANKLRIGKYTANLLLVYDNGKRDIPIESTVSFWVVPYRLIFTIIAIILTPAVLVYIVMRLSNRKKSKK